MDQSPRQRQTERGRLWIALAVSILIHVFIVVLGVANWLGSIDGGILVGEPDYLLVSHQPPRKAPVPSPVPTPVKQAAKTNRPVEPSPNRKRSKRIEVSELPSERLPDSGGEDPEPSSEPIAVTVDTGGGHPNGVDDGGRSSSGYGAARGKLAPRPECMDQLDNDGDLLIDSEDPECLITESPQEEAEVRSKALLLQDIRSNKLPQGDPDELMRERVRKRLQNDGQGGLVYNKGSFAARIGPDGSFTFEQRRKMGTTGLNFGRSKRTRDKLRFLEATQDVRDELYQKTAERQMKRALLGLRANLNELWKDLTLTLSQKRRILFQRLDECDLETEGGREAARIIVEFIRDHSSPYQSGAEPDPGRNEAQGTSSATVRRAVSSNH